MKCGRVKVLNPRMLPGEDKNGWKRGPIPTPGLPLCCCGLCRERGEGAGAHGAGSAGEPPALTQQAGSRNGKLSSRLLFDWGSSSGFVASAESR